MNFLAHIYLSGDNEKVIVGNFIADGIRGKQYKNYPKEIQDGILLHREIDTFTDAHKIVRQSTRRLHKNYGHYSGVIVDILYDHFLAKNWHLYSDVTLENYTKSFYDLMTSNTELLPERVLLMLPHMIAGNWLLSYATIEGITKVLEGMNRRTKNRSQMNLAVNELVAFYAEFEDEFTRFFDELIQFSKAKLVELQKQ